MNYTPSIVKTFSQRNMNELVRDCVNFYRTSIGKEGRRGVHEKRMMLSEWVRKFHRESKTLTDSVEESIGRLEDDSCLLIMTAHQPNLFPYAGVLRKATLSHVLGKRLSDILGLPVIDFFGIADQDFADDRWVRSTLLPDVERRGGTFDLRFDTPRKIMLNKVKLPRDKLEDWRKETEKWLSGKLTSISRTSKILEIEYTNRKDFSQRNLEEFWTLVESAHTDADNYADFNSFIMSRIVNEVWRYGTVFSRFSECQQLFKEEFCFLLSRFEDYSDCISQRKAPALEMEANEHELIPFWYHCDCGSKVRLKAELQDESLSGSGRCIHCGRVHTLDFGSTRDPDISKISDRISARAISMPLIFFPGLETCCYIGGVAGRGYLQRTWHAAQNLGILFPPVAVWRPSDVYLGLGQLEALLMLRKITGTFDFSRLPATITKLRKEISTAKKALVKLKLRRSSLNIKGLSSEVNTSERDQLPFSQNKVAMTAERLSLLSRDLKLLENVEAIRKMHPSILDYAVNIGLKSTSDQWITFLRQEGDFSQVSLYKAT